MALVVCGDAAWLLLKLAVINGAKNPRAYPEELPVFWMHNKKAWITKELISIWFYQSSIPQVELYLAKQNFSFKILLLSQSVTLA